MTVFIKFRNLMTTNMTIDIIKIVCIDDPNIQKQFGHITTAFPGTCIGLSSISQSVIDETNQLFFGKLLRT